MDPEISGAPVATPDTNSSATDGLEEASAYFAKALADPTTPTAAVPPPTNGKTSKSKSAKGPSGRPPADNASDLSQLQNRNRTPTLPTPDPSAAEVDDAPSAQDSDSASVEGQETEGTQETAGTDEQPAQPAGGRAQALPPELQAIIDKRIGREVAKRKSLEEQVAELETQIRAISQRSQDNDGHGSAKPNADLAPLLPDEPDTKESVALRRAEAHARATATYAKSLLRQLREDPETVIGQLKQHRINLPSWAPTAVEEYLESEYETAKDQATQTQYERKLAVRDQQHAKREQERYLQARRTESAQVATQEYGWWLQENSAEYKLAIAILDERPYLKDDPDCLLIVGDMVAAQASRKQRPQGASARPPGTGVPANGVGRPPAPMSRPPALAAGMATPPGSGSGSGERGKVNHLLKKIMSSQGSEEDVAEYFNSVL